MMLVSMTLTLAFSKKPRKVVRWSLITAMLTQTLSFFIFSGVLHRNLAFLWLIAGIGIGAVFGAKRKFTVKEKDIFYTQGRAFNSLYLVFLLINQMIGTFLKAFIPFILFLSAFTVGLQLGSNLTILKKSRKLIKSAAIGMIIILSMSAALIPFQANAVDGTYEFENSRLNTLVRNNGDSLGDFINASFQINMQYTLPSGRKVDHTLPESVVFGNSDAVTVITETKPSIGFYLSRNLVVISIDDYNYSLGDWNFPKEGDFHFNCSFKSETAKKSLDWTTLEIPISEDGSFSGTATLVAGCEREIVNGQGVSGNTETKVTFAGKRDSKGCSLVITQDNGYKQEYYIKYKNGVNPFDKKAAAAGGSEEDEDGWFVLTPVSEGGAGAATGIGGLFGGISGLLISLTGLNFGGGARPSVPLSGNYSGAGQTAPSGEEDLLRKQLEREDNERALEDMRQEKKRREAEQAQKQALEKIKLEEQKQLMKKKQEYEKYIEYLCDKYNTTEEGLDRAIRRQMDKNSEDAEMWVKKAKLYQAAKLSAQATSIVCDTAIDGLASCTGIAGQKVKMIYKVSKGMVTQVSENAMDGFSITSASAAGNALVGGFVKGSIDAATDYVDNLGLSGLKTFGIKSAITIGTETAEGAIGNGWSGAGQGLLKGGYNAIAGGAIDKVTPKGYGGNIIGEGIIRKNNLGRELADSNPFSSTAQKYTLQYFNKKGKLIDKDVTGAVFTKTEKMLKSSTVKGAGTILSEIGIKPMFFKED